jgi:hypothetical protein
VKQDWDLLYVEGSRFKTMQENGYNNARLQEWKIMKFTKHVRLSRQKYRKAEKG